MPNLLLEVDITIITSFSIERSSLLSSPKRILISTICKILPLKLISPLIYLGLPGTGVIVVTPTIPSILSTSRAYSSLSILKTRNC